MTISSAFSRIITFPLYRRNLAPVNISVPLPPTTLCLSSSATFKRPVLVACLKQNQETVTVLEKEKTKEELSKIEEAETATAEIKKKVFKFVVLLLASTVSIYLFKFAGLKVHFITVFTFIWNFLIEMKPHYEEHKWIIDAVKNLYEFVNFVASFWNKKQEEVKKAESVEEKKKKEEMKKAETVDEEEKKIN